MKQENWKFFARDVTHAMLTTDINFTFLLEERKETTPGEFHTVRAFQLDESSRVSNNL